MPKTVKPFTWIVRFDVAPEWVADGFTLSDQRALEMLGRETSGCMSTELAACVLQGPDLSRVLREQGYPVGRARSAREYDALSNAAPAAYVAPVHLAKTLSDAVRLLDSVAFVSHEGDKTTEVLEQLRHALKLVNGLAPISPIEWQETPA